MRPLGGYRPSCPLAALALGGAAALVGSPWINVGPFSSMLHLGIVLLVRLTGGTGMVAVRPLGWIDLLLVLVGTVLAAAPLAVLAQFVGNRTSSFHAPLPALLLALVARLGVPMAAELAGTEVAIGPWAMACMVAIALFGAWLIVTAIQLPSSRRPWSPVVRWSLGCAGLGLAALVTIPLGLVALFVAYCSLAVAWLRGPRGGARPGG